MRISRTDISSCRRANRSLRRYRAKAAVRQTDVYRDTDNSLDETQRSHRCSHACTGTIPLVREGWTSEPCLKPAKIDNHSSQRLSLAPAYALHTRSSLMDVA